MEQPMSSDVLERNQTMGRPKKTQPKAEPKRNDVPVRIGESVLEDIRLIATLRRISIADYLTEVVGPIAKKDLEVELARRTQVIIEEKKKKPSSER
jgi:hypothetical protein